MCCDKYLSVKGKSKEQFSIYTGIGKGVTSLHYNKITQISENKK